MKDTNLTFRNDEGAYENKGCLNPKVYKPSKSDITRYNIVFISRSYMPLQVKIKTTAQLGGAGNKLKLEPQKKAPDYTRVKSVSNVRPRPQLRNKKGLKKHKK